MRLCVPVHWAQSQLQRNEEAFNMYYDQMTEYAKMRDHLITCVDGVIRKHPECGVIMTGDFNQMNDSFLKTHYKFSQIVKVATRGQAILDKIWTNMNMVYSKPVTVAELGTSDHNMVLLKPSSKMTLDTGNLTRMSVKSMGAKEKETFELALSLIKWEPLHRLDSCNEKYVYYQTVIDKLIEICFPSKVVTRHTGDKPWITDGYRLLIRKRQRAHMRRDMAEARSLRNQVNRATAKLKFEFYPTRIEAIHESGTKKWVEKYEKINGSENNRQIKRTEPC